MNQLFPDIPYGKLKWRWASKQPTEGLNRPDVYLGVLRALSRCEGKSKSSQDLFDELKITETLLHPMHAELRLARDSERNLLRNSGQYWSALGTLTTRHQIIELTDLGRRYASGEMSFQEFGNHVVNCHTLPNAAFNKDELSAWNNYAGELKPLKLILQTLTALTGCDADSPQDYITADELGRVIQPLSCISGDPATHSRKLLEYRLAPDHISDWPNMVTGANDLRILNEFLLFLAYYGYLAVDPYDKNKYLLVSTPQFTNETKPFETDTRQEETVDRGFVWREVRHRPGQAAFRRAVLRESGSNCLFTGTRVSQTLQAAHIRPVEFDGSDEPSNGLCLRADIHLLFDANLIRISPTGQLSYHESISKDPKYADLPSTVVIPDYVDRKNIIWRHQLT